MGTERIPVGVSSCLMGNRVRYDGTHKLDNNVAVTLAEYFDFLAFCPEVAIGLGVPRPTIRLVAAEGGPRAVGTRDRSLEVTGALRDYAVAQRADVAGLSGFIFKKGSPSCGTAGVAIFSNSDTVVQRGAGLFAAAVMDHFPALPVAEEVALVDGISRENFVERVFIYHDWRTRVASALAEPTLADFHARLELSLASRGSLADFDRLMDEARQTGSGDLARLAGEYIETAMACLRQIPDREGHAEALQRIRHRLQPVLGIDDMAALTDAIDQYRRDEVSLVVPLTLLRHYLRCHPDPYLESSWYIAHGEGH